MVLRQIGRQHVTSTDIGKSGKMAQVKTAFFLKKKHVPVGKRQRKKHIATLI